MDYKPQEPNFEGEKMKLPSIRPAGREVSGTGVQSVIILILLLVLTAILVGLFLWYRTGFAPTNTPLDNLRPTAEQNKEPETPTAVAQVESMNALSTSDELATIEADLESTLLDSLESELTQIESDLSNTTP